MRSSDFARSNVHPLSTSESITLAILTVLSCYLVCAYLIDLAGFALHFQLIFFAVLFPSLIAIVRWLHAYSHVPITAGFALTIVGIGVYLLWLTAPNFLPVAFSFDLAHHVQLTEFVRSHSSLVHDPKLAYYLLEFAQYTPGAHLLAALVADLFNLTSTQGIYVTTACLLSVKAGIIYNLALRLQARASANASLAVATSLFLLVVPAYFIESFTVWGFYAQVVSELFILAMLWALMVWHVRPSTAMLLFFALCGVATFLVWPVWLPVPLLVLVALLSLHRELPSSVRIRHILVAVGPVVGVGLLYSVTRLGAASEVLSAEGGVVKPGANVFSEVFLILTVLGVIVCLRQRPRTIVLLLFAGAALLQLLALFLFDSWVQEHSYYETFKIFHLLFYAMLLFVALALADLWRAVEQAIAPRFSQVSVLSLILPVLVLLLAVQRGLPVPAGSPQTAQLYDAAQWARDHLPRACVAYLVDDKERAYWLHVAVLGNPRDTPRVDELLRTRDRARVNELFWSDERALPYAIVPAARMMPAEARARFDLLYASGEAIVVQRKAANSCPPEVVPLDRVVVAPRGWTLAGALAAMLPK